jgi:hypothetical protein
MDGRATSHSLVTKSYYRGLWDASEDGSSNDRQFNALTSAALMMGQYENESLGWALLASMKCTLDPEIHAGLRWILENRCAQTGPIRLVRGLATKLYG